MNAVCSYRRSHGARILLNDVPNRMFKMELLKIEQRIRGMIHDSEEELRDSPFLEAALYRTMKESNGRASEDELCRRVIERAREHHREWVVPQQQEEGTGKTGEVPFTPTDMLAGEALVRALAPQVEELRIAVFGSPEPPFDSLREASDWIEQQEERDLAALAESAEEKQRAWEEIEKLADSHGIELGFKNTLLPYQKHDDGHVKYVHAEPRTYLHKLARKVRSMAKHTGLGADALIVHVLTGLKPVKGRARITTTEHLHTLPSGEQIATTEATVTFRARDLADEELRSIYNAVRGHVGGKGTTGLGYKDVKLWELVQDLGGPPQEHGSKGAFWEEVRQRYDRHFPGEITTTNGVKGRYKRISRHLSPR